MAAHPRRQRAWFDRWALPLAIVLTGLLVTCGGWYQARRSAAARTRRQFADAAAQAEASVRREVRAHVDLIESIATHAAASFPPSTGSLTWFVQHLDLGRRYPAVDGVGLVERVDAAGTPALEARLRADGRPDFRVVARPGVDERLVLTEFVQESATRVNVPVGIDFVSLSLGQLLRVRQFPEPLFYSIGSLRSMGLPTDMVPPGVGFIVVTPVFDRTGHDAHATPQGVVGWIVAPIEGPRFLDQVAGSPAALDLALGVDGPDGRADLLAHVPARSRAALDQGLHRRTAFRIGATTWVLDVRGAGFGASASDLSTTLFAAGLLITLLLATAVSGRRTSTRRTRALATALEHRERWASVLLESASDPLVVLDRRGIITYANRAARALLPDSAPSRSTDELLDRVDPDGRPAIRDRLDHLRSTPGATVRFVARMRDAADQWVDLEFALTNLLDDPAIGGVVVAARDVSEHKRIEAILEHEAQHDPLTGLANRVYLYERLQVALAPGRGGPDLVGLLFVDLDEFKQVNDEFGHAAGDDVLRCIAERLRSAVRAADTVARLGGDEFVVLCEGLTDARQAAVVAAKLDEALAVPIAWSGHEISVSASIGVVVGHRSADLDPDTLVNTADRAMYRAKQGGRRRIELALPTA